MHRVIIHIPDVKMHSLAILRFLSLRHYKTKGTQKHDQYNTHKTRQILLPQLSYLGYNIFKSMLFAMETQIYNATTFLSLLVQCKGKKKFIIHLFLFPLILSVTTIKV